MDLVSEIPPKQKCKIYRKKGDDSTLLLCDECKQAFHMHCLRPALFEVPSGDWLCPASAQSKTNKRYVKRYFGSDSGAEGSSDDEIEHEEKCVRCGNDENLILCAKCPSAYHIECHDPPHHQREKHYEESEDSTEEESSESEEEEDISETEEEEKEPPKKSQRRSQDTTAHRGRPPKDINSKPKERAVKKGRNSLVEDSDQNAKPAASRRAPSDLSICEQNIANTMKHKSCWPFLNPVNKKEVPDYYQIVKHPLDFQIVKDRLQCLVYGSTKNVIEDVKLIFNNAELYNQEGCEISDHMKEVEKYFSEQMKKHLPAFPYSRKTHMNGHVEVNDSCCDTKKSR